MHTHAYVRTYMHASLEVPAFDDSACRLLDEMSTKLSLSVAQEVIMKEVRCCCVDCAEADVPYMLHAGA